MSNKRRDKDVMKIMVSGYKVELPDESKMNEIIVNFPGPQDSPYKDVSPPAINSLLSSETPKWVLNIPWLVAGSLESESLVARLVPDQVTVNRIP